MSEQIRMPKQAAMNSAAGRSVDALAGPGQSALSTIQRSVKQIVALLDPRARRYANKSFNVRPGVVLCVRGASERCAELYIEGVRAKLLTGQDCRERFTRSTWAR